MKKVAMITGANRGIGRATACMFAARGFHVVAACRDKTAAAAVVEEIRRRGGSADTVMLDLADPASVHAAAGKLLITHPKLHALVNNAAIMTGEADSILTTDVTALQHALRVNTWGPLELTKAVLPAIRASGAGRIVNLSSRVAAIAETADAESPYAALDRAPYRVSKSALNMITVLLAKALCDEGIKVNAMCPGWTRTDMGGSEAPNPPERAAALAFELATLTDDGPTGQFFEHGGLVPW